MSGIAEDRKPAIQEELERVVSSTAFSGSERHRRFLRFVVEQALTGDTDKLNEFVLGFEVFNKNESFDPRIDSIVRVEARRLRERLKKYYAEEGSADPVIITLRPRSFVPEFHSAAEEHHPAAAAAVSTWVHFHKLAAIIVAAALFGAAVTAIVIAYRSKKPAIPQTASILILPFQTLSPASGQDVLGDAIADAIITGLAGSPGLRVISRGSGIQFKESGRSPYQYAADLQVDYIVEGTVQSDATHTRVSAKMTDVHTQSYVWAETREIKPDALASLEREFTTAISSRIRIPLPPDSGERVVRRRAASFQAYGAFLKGQYYWYQQARGSTEKSIALFEEAIRGDANYAPAWAWLSQAYYLQVLYSDGRDAALIAKGRQAAQKALSLDNNLAEAHTAVASYAALDWDWPTAEREFRRGIELNPGSAHGHMAYSMLYLAPTGQMRAAVGEMFRAHELDPLTKITRSMLIEVLYCNHNYARVIAEAEDLRKPSPAPSPDDRPYFLSLSLSGQGARALAEMTSSASANNARSPGSSLLGYLLARHGDRQKAIAIQQYLLKASETGFVPPVAVATVSVGLGDHSEVFRQLQRAVASHSPMVCQMIADPVFDPIRSDPRYTEIVRAIGLKSNR